MHIIYVYTYLKSIYRAVEFPAAYSTVKRNGITINNKYEARRNHFTVSGISLPIFFESAPVTITNKRTGLTILDRLNAMPAIPASGTVCEKQYPIISKSGAYGVMP